MTDNIDFNVSVQELEIDGDEKVKGIQIQFKSINLNWFIHSHKNIWRNSFIHTPEEKEDKLPSKLNIVDSLNPIWLISDEKRNKRIMKVFSWCGIDKEEVTGIVSEIKEFVLLHGIQEIDIADPYACEKMVHEADIDYDNPLWFMIDKKFSPKAVARRVIELFLKQEHRIKTIKETKEILIFNGGIYVNGEDEVERTVRDLLGHRASIHYVNEVNGEIRSSTLTLLSDFNPGHCINLLNGVYDIPMKTFRDGDEGIYDEPDMLFTYKLQVHYDPDATCPEIEKFFEWALPDEIHREQVYEEFAYAFAPGYPIQKMFMWYGAGRNGKGVAAGLLRNIIGGENISGWSVFNLENNNSFCQADMVTKKYNICGDLPSIKVPFDFIKAATGNDIIPIKPIWKEPYNTINACKMLFMMNNMIVISDFSDGALSRIITTVWGVQINEKDVDPHLLEKLTTNSEISGFFNLLTDSYDNLMERRHFIFNPSTEDTEALLSELRGEDAVLFITEKCVTGKDLKYDRKMMYDDYKEWHESRRTKPKGKKIFNSFMRKFGFKDIPYGPIRVWTGIGKMKEEEMIKIKLNRNGKKV